MSALLFHLGRSSARHPFRVLGLWLVAAIAIVVVNGTLGGQFDDTFRVPGVESQRAIDVLQAHFPTQGGQSARIVLHADAGRLDDAAHEGAINRLHDRIAAGRDVAGVTDAVISADGRTAYVDVAYTTEKLSAANLTDVRTAAATVGVIAP